MPIDPQPRGSILILTLILTSLTVFLGIYVLSFSLTDRTLAQSHARALQAYYFGEAGINHAIFRLKNDGTYANGFETDAGWQTEFTLANPFGAAGGYTVAITNTGLARADIVSTASLSFQGTAAQRVVRTKVFKAIGSINPLGENAGYADGNIDISASDVRFHNGSAHSNNNFTVNVGSTVSVDTALNAVNNLIINGGSAVTVNGLDSEVAGAEIYAANYANGPAPAVTMPAIDFDSSDSRSYKSRAATVYSEAQFGSLLEAADTVLALPGPITYVEGDIVLRGDRDLAVTGALIAERDIIIGDRNCWQGHCGPSNVTVTVVPGEPSGLLAKRKIKFDLYTGDIAINGLVYANDQITVTTFTDLFDVTGGLVSRKLTITSVWQPLDVYRDDVITAPAFNEYTSFSPVISIEHWEEEY